MNNVQIHDFKLFKKLTDKLLAKTQVATEQN